MEDIEPGGAEPVVAETSGAAVTSEVAETVVTIRRYGPDDWREFRLIRMEALRESPTAFGSTYADAERMGEPDWRRRLGSGVMFGAVLPDGDGAPVGICGGFVEDPGDTGDGSAVAGSAAAHQVVGLVSMWVRPGFRGRRIGPSLVEAVVGWAVGAGSRHVRLWVTAGNESAIRLYERCGFALTGNQEPLPSDPSLTELEMSRTLDPLPSSSGSAFESVPT